MQELENKILNVFSYWMFAGDHCLLTLELHVYGDDWRFSGHQETSL